MANQHHAPLSERHNGCADDFFDLSSSGQRILFFHPSLSFYQNLRQPVFFSEGKQEKVTPFLFTPPLPC